MGAKKEKTVTFSLRMPEGLRDALGVAASQDGISITQLVLRVLTNQTPKMEPRHEKALSILRQQAMAQAVQCATPGEQMYLLERRAECIVDYMLSDRL